jgi:lipopolysaccharide export system permease protein
MLPYFITASFLAIVTFYFNGWLIPHANKSRLDFEYVYIRNPYVFKDRNIHRQISPGTLIYMDSYNNRENIGFRFSMEKIKDGKRIFFLNSDRIRWDSVPRKWVIENYFIRMVNGMKEEIQKGLRLDTALKFEPKDFRQRISAIDAMDNKALSDYIEELKLQGSSNYMVYQVERYRRFAFPFATFILTLIGVSLASRKVRGGIGLHLGAGISLSFTYILFIQVSTTFAINGDLPPLLAVWIPNIIFSGVAAALLRYAPK